MTRCDTMLEYTPYDDNYTGRFVNYKEKWMSYYAAV